MSFYPNAVQELFRRPKNAGSVAQTSAIGTAGAPSCGAIVRLTVRIDPFDHTIREAKFKTSGCPFAIAAASLLTEILGGVSVPDAASLLSPGGGWNQVVQEKLGEYPSGNRHCADLPRDALAATLSDYQTTFREQAPIDEALICTCFFVSEKTIEDAILDQDLTTVAEVTRSCRAGGGCGSCQPLIAELIDSAQRQILETDHDLLRQ